MISPTLPLSPRIQERKDGVGINELMFGNTVEMEEHGILASLFGTQSCGT
jgi:hypothetical protein